MVEQALITVVGVVLGVGLAEWGVRVRDRRHRIESATVELAMLIPHVVTVMWDGWQGTRPDTSIGSEWFVRFEEISKLVGAVRADARWPLRRADAIRKEAEDLAARLAAAQMNWMSQQVPVRGSDLHEITTASLYSAVFEGLKPLDAGVSFYRAHGYGKRWKP